MKERRISRAYAITKSNFVRWKKELAEYWLSKTPTCQVGHGSNSNTNGSHATRQNLHADDSIVDESEFEIYDSARNISIPVSTIQAPEIVKNNAPFILTMSPSVLL